MVAVGHDLGVTVAEVLALLPGVACIAGEGGTKRLVRSVGVMETPDVFPLVKQGELILSALFALKDDPQALAGLVPELHRRGAAGLGIKKRYVAQLPPEMLEHANRLAFPLLELPAEAAFSDISLPVYSQIVNRQTAFLLRQQQAHKMVMKAVLEGRGISRLAQTLAELLGNPVVFRDEAGQILAAARAGSSGELDLEALTRTEAISAEYMVSGGETLHLSEVVLLQGQKLSRIVTPIVSGSYRFGQITVWETEQKVAELDLSIIDSVSTVVALEMANQRALLEVERRYKGEFLQALFAKEIDSEGPLLGRARTFGWDLTRTYYVVALRVSAADSAGHFTPEEIQLARDLYFDAVARVMGSGMVGQAELHTVVLLPPRRQEEELREEAVQQAQGLLGLAEPYRKWLKVSAGVGRVHSGVKGLRKSFEEACRSVSVGDKVWGGGKAYHYDDLGIYQLLSMLEPNADMQQFLGAVDQLAAYDRENRTDLIQTLDVYFACKGNVRKASEKLFAHYNTVAYRLERIQQITGFQLENAAGRLHLQVALQVARLFGKLPSAVSHNAV